MQQMNIGHRRNRNLVSFDHFTDEKCPCLVVFITNVKSKKKRTAVNTAYRKLGVGILSDISVQYTVLQHA